LARGSEKPSAGSLFCATAPVSVLRLVHSRVAETLRRNSGRHSATRNLIPTPDSAFLAPPDPLIARTGAAFARSTPACKLHKCEHGLLCGAQEPKTDPHLRRRQHFATRRYAADNAASGQPVRAVGLRTFAREFPRPWLGILDATQHQKQQQKKLRRCQTARRLRTHHRRHHTELVLGPTHEKNQPHAVAGRGTNRGCVPSCC